VIGTVLGISREIGFYLGIVQWTDGCDINRTQASNRARETQWPYGWAIATGEICSILRYYNIVQEPSFPPINYLGDRMPNCNPSPLHLFFRQPGSNTNFECWL